MDSLQAIHHISANLIQTFQQIKTICEEGMKQQSKSKDYLKPIHDFIGNQFKRSKQEKSSKMPSSFLGSLTQDDSDQVFVIDQQRGKKSSKMSKMEEKNGYDYYEEEQPPKKKKRSDRDPNKPKKPLGAFFIFQEQERQNYKRKYKSQGLSINEIRRKMSANWSYMPQHQKRKYIDQYDEDMEIYRVQIEKYYNKYPSQRPVPGAKRQLKKKKQKQGYGQFMGQNQTKEESGVLQIQI